jgi:hypothetical protein
LLRGAGFDVTAVRGHGYVQVDNPVYLLGVVDRGADALVVSDVIGPDLAVALKAEARRRAADGTFYGTITYTSAIGHKPDR